MSNDTTGTIITITGGGITVITTQGTFIVNIDHIEPNFIDGRGISINFIIGLIMEGITNAGSPKNTTTILVGWLKNTVITGITGQFTATKTAMFQFGLRLLVVAGKLKYHPRTK